MLCPNLQSKEPHVPNGNLVFYCTVVKTGWYIHLDEGKQICSMCSPKELHFVFMGLFYAELHNTLFYKIDFVSMDGAQRLSWLCTNVTFRLAAYLEEPKRMRKKAFH